MKKFFLVTAISVTAVSVLAQDATVKDLQNAAGKEVKSAEKER